jgi:hypothetical protein
MQKIAPPYENCLIGAASFDLSGLPKEYFILNDSTLGISWLQPVFQVIGLRSLLSASLGVENFRYSVMQGSEFAILIMRKQNDYLALLLEGDIASLDAPPDQLLDWANHIDIKFFRQNPLYRAV